MGDRRELHALAEAMGVATRYVDGLGKVVVPNDDTLAAVCRALGAAVEPGVSAADALIEWSRARRSGLVPGVIIAWDGHFDGGPDLDAVNGLLRLEAGDSIAVEAGRVPFGGPLPIGYHRLELDNGDHGVTTVISAPTRVAQLPPEIRWGVTGHLAALRTSRTREVGDLADLAELARIVGNAGGNLVTLLPLLATFNDDPVEPSPYSPVSRLFWNELHLDLGEAHRARRSRPLLDLRAADIEVRSALAASTPDRSLIDPELARYAAFRGAQARLGRTWTRWAPAARAGDLTAPDVDIEEERFHLVAQLLMRRQLSALGADLPAHVRLGLDLAVGVHPDGYDIWSRQELFAPMMSVGAPPDAGFPSGQNWGFPPLLPASSMADGHRYFAESVRHHASIASVLRIDHVMALDRLYWIPEGADLSEGTYVRYPAEELFAVLSVESHRAGCALVGENLGTVSPAIGDGLERHSVMGMYVAQFAARKGMRGPSTSEAALINTHDTPTLAGWVGEIDIDERLRVGLLKAAAARIERRNRRASVEALKALLSVESDDLGELLEAVLAWIGTAQTPLVSVSLEDLWLEEQPVNIPGTSSGQRPNWLRPHVRTLEAVRDDPILMARLDVLRRARDRTAAIPGRL